MNSDKKSKIAIKGLGEKLITARRKLGLTQDEVAKMSKMTTNYYAMIERDEVNPSYSKLQSLAKVLKIEIKIG